MIGYSLCKLDIDEVMIPAKFLGGITLDHKSSEVHKFKGNFYVKWNN